MATDYRNCHICGKPNYKNEARSNKWKTWLICENEHELEVDSDLLHKTKFAMAGIAVIALIKRINSLINEDKKRS